MEYVELLKPMSVQELLLEAERVKAEMERQSSESLIKLNVIKLEVMSRQVSNA